MMTGLRNSVMPLKRILGGHREENYRHTALLRRPVFVGSGRFSRHKVQAVCALRGRSGVGADMRVPQGRLDAFSLLPQKQLLPRL
jgi:hypothetical protein